MIQAGLAITDYAEPDELFLGPVYFAFALLFLATAFFSFLGPLQAGLFYGLAAVETVSTLNCFYGLGFAAVAVIILFRRGWFFRNAKIKAPHSRGDRLRLSRAARRGIQEAAIALVPALISAGVYSILVYGLAKGRFLSALAPKKPVLKLSRYRLNRREEQVVRGRILGKTVKELAAESGVAVSTIRNALASACRKLGIEGREALAAMGERFRVE